MDEQQMLSSSSSSILSPKKYDVFLSFQSDDMHLTFASHLYKALSRKEIKTFINVQLEKGDEISTTLIEAIKDSYISIVIFSKNYASSKWCLNELSTIMKCKKVQNQIVLPVFHDIDPSHVRKQIGSYEQAFAIHKKDPRCHQWRKDLTAVANIAGFYSKNRIESELVDEIVEVVLQTLVFRYSDQHHHGLVRFDESYEDIKSLLNIRSNEVKILGIWGMGGIGKTTLATALYEKLSHKFEGCCFLTNVREKSEKLENLCKELFSNLSGKVEHSFDASELRGLLQHKKVFIVLDDVSTIMQLEEVIYQFYPLGPGSRVIVTTRDKQIFRSDAIIYEVQKLNPHHSLEVFCSSVFDQKQPKDGYENISKEVISYCGGIPLALKIMGARLHSTSKEFWECELNKLHNIPDMKIQKVLKLSYDDLNNSEQRIFLDIACFHKGQPRDYVTKILEAFDFFSIIGIEVLLDKALVTISKYTGIIEMHDLLREMGQEIVRQESTKFPERRSRLWKYEEVIDVLKKNKDNDDVEGILLDLKSLNKSLSLDSDFLAKMTRLRFFKVDGHDWSFEENFNIYLLNNGLNSFSDKLRCFHWDNYCIDALPSNFNAEHLVVLIMRRSKLNKLWNGVQNLVNLKAIDLEHSIYLTDIPDLSKAKNLESVNLNGCESLHQLHPSILSNSTLKYLNLCFTSLIGSLDIHSKYLSQLYLHECSYLKEISIASEEITKLKLSGTAITSFSCISSLPKLEYLDLSYCKGIEILDLHTKSLIELDLSGCSSLKEISMVSEEITELNLSGTAITSLPSSISSLPKLTSLDLSECRNLVSLRKLPSTLQVLNAFNCISLEREISQRVVLQHMLQKSIPYLHQQQHHHPRNGPVRDCYFVFPWDRVIDDRVFQTAKSSISIRDFEMSHLRGFIYCFILFKAEISYKMLVSIYQDGELLWDSEYTSFNTFAVFFTTPISKHVGFWYHDISKFDRENEGYDHSKDVEIKFELYEYYGQNVTKGFGVFPVYATTSGFELEISESQSIDNTVEDVLQKFAPRYPHQLEGLVGIKKSYEEIKLLLKAGPDEVKTLGIWGMGGIGKTTLATALYEELSHEFEGHCFIANVREKSEKVEVIREELFSKLFGEKNCTFETFEKSWFLQRKRVFIVLDDVATKKELEELIYQFDLLRPGSRVIVTTRFKEIFRSNDVTYPVQELSFRHSLELFCLVAFEEKQLKDGYEDISKEVISYCGGIPLALKVVGASLYSKSKEVWECQLNKLQSIPETKIQNVLKLSYDDLDHSQQNIFLDIACFFKGEPRKYAISVLETFDIFSVYGIKALLDKALVTIPKDNNKIEMHDLIQKMGQEIVHQESIEYLERQSRLWKHEEVVDVLKKNKGNDVIEGITLDLQKLNENLYLNSNSLAKMTRLRFFKIHGHGYMKENFNVYLPNDLQSFSNKLRYLYWDKYCLESLPTNFSAEQLVEFHMRHSKLKKLWDGVQNLENLKKIDLWGSQVLIDIPNLSNAKKLEHVNFGNCESLKQLHSSISHNSKIKFLDLSGCRKIESLNIHSEYLCELYVCECSSLKEISVKSNELTVLNLSGSSKLESLNVYSKSLRELYLIRFSSLKRISVTSDKMTILKLRGTAICTLMSSMLSLPKLTCLDLSDCKEIESLNLHLKSLKELDLSGCSSLKYISVASEELTKLLLSGTAITTLSSSMSSLPKLTCLDLSDCKEIERLDLHLKSLQELDLSGCSSLKEISVVESEEITKLLLCGTTISTLSSSMSSLPKLTYLDLSDCKEIERLNLDLKSLKELDLRGCSSLKEISMASKEITKLVLSGTSARASLSWIGNLLSLEVLDLSRSNVESLPANINSFGNMRELNLKGNKKLVSLPELPPSLSVLQLDDCRNLESLPELPSNLYALSAFNCILLEISQSLVLKHMLERWIPYFHKQSHNLWVRNYFVFPGDYVTDECVFYTTESSISIPWCKLKTSHLSGFVYCIILSQGSLSHEMLLSIYQDDIQLCHSRDGWDDKYTSCENPISDHVMFWYHDISKYDRISERISEVRNHSSEITFIFKFDGDQKGINGFGVAPVYSTKSGFDLEISESEFIEREQPSAFNRRMT